MKQKVSFTRRQLKAALKKTSYIDEIRWLLTDNKGNMPSREDIESRMGSGRYSWQLGRKYRLRYGLPDVYFNPLEIVKGGISFFLPNELLSAGGYERGTKFKPNICGNCIKIIKDVEQVDRPLPDLNEDPNIAFKNRCPESGEEVRCPKEEIECYKCGKFFKPTEMKKAPCGHKNGRWALLCNTCYNIWLTTH